MISNFKVLGQFLLTLAQVVALVAIFQVVAVTTPSAAAGPATLVTDLQYDARVELI